MVIGFKKQFVEPIMAGTKKQTIRADKHNRWKAGRQIQMATGVRTKHYNCFKSAECISTQAIDIIYHECIDPGEGVLFEIKVDDKVLNFAEMITLAINDGFETLGDFMDWFNKDFTGKIIHWTDLKY